MKREKIWLAAGISLLMMLMAGIALSRAQENTGVFYACVNNSSGTIKIVAASATCKQNETKISWNQTGPTGQTPDRYVDLKDGTLLDRHTGLVWLKDANCAFLSPNNWTDANHKAAKIESGTCGLSDGSWEGDWRLPTKTEWMATIAEAKAMGCTDPVLTDLTGTTCYSSGTQWAENINVTGCGYWTSTPHFSEPGIAPYVHLSNGGFGPGAKDNNCFNAWPVRGGPEGQIK